MSWIANPRSVGIRRTLARTNMDTTHPANIAVLEGSHFLSAANPPSMKKPRKGNMI
jgi:hypothetical protein